MVGGPYDNSRTGAAWVFKLSSDTWSQQGNKLVGNGSDGKAAQGASVALSADGNTAIVGGPHDNSKGGAAWVFTRSGDNSQARTSPWTMFFYGVTRHQKALGRSLPCAG